MLDPESPVFAAKVEARLVSLQSSDRQDSLKKTELLTWLAQHELLACPRTAGPAPENPHFLIDDVPYGGVISHCRQVHEVLRIAETLVDDPATWEVIPRICESFIRLLPQDRALISYCKHTLVPGVKRAKGATGTALNAPRMKAMLASYAAWNRQPRPSVRLRRTEGATNLMR